MEARLEEASLNGDLLLLHQLLQEDKLLLSRPTATDNPLHIAASLGHVDFAHEILNRNPDLARGINGHGLSPLHLASANGHLSIVKELLKKPGPGLCLLSDKDGMMPIHTAASKGRIDVLEELVGACLVSARAVTHRDDTVLHLAVRSNSFEATKFLVEKLVRGADDEFINAKDDQGNTALHMAVGRKQIQTVKLLLTKRGIINVNPTNKKGLTPLDLLLLEPLGDLALAELIRSAGGKTREEIVTTHRDDPDALHAERQRENITKEDEDSHNTPGTLMVVSTLIAAITFQAGLNPPGGFFQANGTTLTAVEHDEKLPLAGKVVLGGSLTYFLLFDVVGLFASLSIILLLICVVPQRRKMLMRVLVWVMWVAVFCTALAFQCALVVVYDDIVLIGVMAIAWFGLLRVAIVSISIRFIIHMMRWVGWLKRKRVDNNSGHHGENSRNWSVGALLLLKRVVVVVSAVAVVAAAAFVNIKLESWMY